MIVSGGNTMKQTNKNCYVILEGFSISLACLPLTFLGDFPWTSIVAFKSTPTTCEIPNF